MHDYLQEIFDRITRDPELVNEQRQILFCAVRAMADEFRDVTFEQIPHGQGVDPKILEYFCDCVRYRWSVDVGGDGNVYAVTSRAIRCPHSDAEMIALIQQFEKRSGRIWNPRKCKGVGRYERETAA
jgi:hypothetical protein